MLGRIVSLVVMGAALSQAQTWIRVDRLGWSPAGAKKAVILSDSDLTGKPWSLRDASGAVKASGVLPSTLVAKNGQNPKAYAALLEFTHSDTGTWTLSVPGDSMKIRTAKGSHTFLARQALRHLRLMRSGPDQSLFRGPSHLGDFVCAVQVPDGAWNLGKWKPEASGRKVRAVGGWYDAGDQIKFTLTTAYTTYHLLRAWEENPGIQARWLSPTAMPDLLDEARHGLDYLQGLLVDDTTFVIQVGDALDHAQGQRLPEVDALDGKRPALCALSPMPMGLTAASLALGARLFRTVDPERAQRYQATALRIDSILRRPGAAREAAYLKDQVNDFYRDDSPWDNLALMAAELWLGTGDTLHLSRARAWADSAGITWEPGWAEMHLSAHLRLAAVHAPSREKVKTILGNGRNWGQKNAPLWGIPYQPIWGPLLGMSAMAGDALTARRTLGDTTAQELGRDIMDYTLGRNNWGVSFFMSPNIAGSVRNIYSPHYVLNGEFPLGAIAEGPGSRTTHEGLVEYFSLKDPEPTEPFNTSTTVFYDNATDFQTMETVISQQGTFLYHLGALARAEGDTVPGLVPPEVVEENGTVGASDTLRIPLTKTAWSVYDDASEGGVSTASLEEATDTSATFAFKVGLGETLEYGYVGMSQTLGTKAKALPWAQGTGFRLRMDLPRRSAVRVQLVSSLVMDYDHHGLTVVGKGDGVYELRFADLAQQGFGKTVGFDPSKITGIELVVSQVGLDTSIRVDGAWLLASKSTGIAALRSGRAALRVNGGRLEWTLERGGFGRIRRIDASGRSLLLREGELARRGSLELPDLAGAAWIVLEAEGMRQVVPVVRMR